MVDRIGISRGPHAVTGEHSFGGDSQRRKLDLPATPYPRSPQQANILTPAERFLNQFACFLTQRISGMAGRARADRRAALSFGVLRHVRSYLEFARLLDELTSVVGFVRPHRTAPRTPQRFKHLQCRRGLEDVAYLLYHFWTNSNYLPFAAVATGANTSSSHATVARGSGLSPIEWYEK